MNTNCGFVNTNCGFVNTNPCLVFIFLFCQKIINSLKLIYIIIKLFGNGFGNSEILLNSFRNFRKGWAPIFGFERQKK